MNIAMLRIVTTLPDPGSITQDLQMDIYYSINPMIYAPNCDHKILFISSGQDLICTISIWGVDYPAKALKSILSKKEKRILRNINQILIERKVKGFKHRSEYITEEGLHG